MTRCILKTFSLKLVISTIFNLLYVQHMYSLKDLLELELGSDIRIGRIRSSEYSWSYIIVSLSYIIDFIYRK
jgi:hypothetical protein